VSFGLVNLTRLQFDFDAHNVAGFEFLFLLAVVNDKCVHGQETVLDQGDVSI